MAMPLKTGARSAIGKAASEIERNVPIRAETRGSNPSAVSVGLNRSKVRLNSKTTKSKAATCAASSIWLSMPRAGSQDINRDWTTIALNVAKTPNAASRDALPKTSPRPAKRKDSITLQPVPRAPPFGWDGGAERGVFSATVKVALHAAIWVGDECRGKRLRAAG